MDKPLHLNFTSEIIASWRVADPYALNYDETSVLDDGTCFYEGDICSSALAAIEGDDGNSSDGDEEWFYYTATMDGFLTITTCYEGQAEDTDLTVFSECPSSGGYELNTNDDAYCGLITGGNNYGSELTISVNTGDTYYIFWDDTWSPLPFTWYMYETAPEFSIQLDCLSWARVSYFGLGSDAR